MARTDLGKWMITNGGEYDEHTAYENLTMVKYGQSTYITLKSVTGVEPTDDRENYMLMAQGFDAAALASATVEDTHGVMSDGEPEQPPAVVSAQTLIDAIADRVMNQLVSNTTLAAQLANYIPVSKIVDNLLSTDAETVLSGKMGKQLSDLITANSNAISTLNSAQEATVQCDHTTYHNYIAKIRGIVYLNLEIVTQSKGETRWVAIATIPEGFRPKWSFRTPITYNDTVAVGSINSSGAIAIALPFESNVQMQVIGVWNT